MLEGCTPWPEEFVKRYTEAGYWKGQTVGEMLDEAAAKFGPRPAVAGDDGTRFSYNNLKRLSDRMALHFVEMGLRPKDRILVQFHNFADFVPIYFGLEKAGVIPVLCLPQYRFYEMQYFGALTEARAYLVPSSMSGFDHYELAQQVRESVPSIEYILTYGDETRAGSVPVKPLLADPIEERILLSRLREVRPDPLEVSLFFLTGGTTGMPKLVPRTHNDLILGSKSVFYGVPMDETTVFLCITPLAHFLGLGPALLPTLIAGGKFVISQSPEAEHVFELIEREKVTAMVAVPTIYIRFMNHPSFTRYDLSSLKFVLSGGQKLQPAVKPVLAKAFQAEVCEGLGMSEGLICWPRLDDPPEVRTETVGFPATPGDEIRLVDDQGRDVPEGSVGELLGRGPAVIRGYYKDPEHNRDAFTEDGYYRTGDLVRRGPGGGLVVEGRRKDIINRGGEKFGAEEIENLIIAHPAVHDVAVTGMPDREMGERICAYVIPNSGQDLTLAQICSFLLTKNIAKFKLPERLELVNEFPLTSMGKVSKRHLRADITRKLEAERGETLPTQRTI